MKAPVPDELSKPTIIALCVWFGLWGLHYAGEISEGRAMWCTVCLFLGYFTGHIDGERGTGR